MILFLFFTTVTSKRFFLVFQFLNYNFSQITILKVEIKSFKATTTAINATVVSASTNAQKAVHVVPLPVSKTVHVAPQVAPKVVVQSGVQLRLQPSNYATTSQCIDTWPQSNQRTVINPSFEHSSISQVFFFVFYEVLFKFCLDNFLNYLIIF